MGQINLAFISTLIYIVTGFFLKNRGIIAVNEGKVLSRLLMHTTFPALMIVSTKDIELNPTLFLIPLFAIGISAIMLTMAYFLFKKELKAIRGVFTMSSGGWNVGLFGFPLIESIWGAKALLYAILYDIGNTFLAFGVLYPIGNHFSEVPSKGIFNMLKKVLLLPPVLGMLIGLTLNGTNLTLLPVIEEVLLTLAKANKPFVLLLLGIYLSIDIDKKLLNGIFKVLFIRYGVGLMTIIGIYLLLPATLMTSVLIALVILPVGMSVLMFSDELGFDSRIAGTLTNISLLISFGLLWIIISVLQL
ncbi:MAG: AEC family transporter [Bacteroidota bacterium]